MRRSLRALALVAPLLAGAVPIALAPPALADESARLFDAKTFSLKNGLQVVVVEDHRMPVVSHMVWYKVGAADEPAGKSGLAHLLEHLMFKGTPSVPPGRFSRIVAEHGGRDNAFTSSDYTAYFQNIAADQLGLVMKLEADRMRNLRLDEKDFQTERDVVVEERLSRTENEPAALLDERADLALWVNHPYRNPVIGWASELKALTRQDALDYYKRFYAPDNAVLVVAGDVTVEQVRALAEKHYGALKRGPGVERQRDRARPPEAATRISMHHPRVSAPRWSQRLIAPGYGTASAGERDQIYALQVLSELLGGGATSRLYRALVVEQGLAAAAGSGYSARAVDWGSFVLYATPRQGVTVEAVEQAVQAQVARLLRDGVSPEEVEAAKLRMRAGVIYARDSLQGPAQTVGQVLATGGDLDELETWPAHVAAVTPEQVMAAARAVLRPDGGVTAILLPAAAPAPGPEAKP